MGDSRFYVHPSSYVDASVLIGDNTKIWHFCHIMEGSVIGNDAVLGQNVFIGRNVQVGDRVKIQNNVSVFEGVVIEDDVFLGPSVVFTNVLNPRSFINRKDQFLATRVSRGATIGANATVICGLTIGSYALIGAGAVVTKDVLPFALVVGNPARQMGWVSETGHPLKFDENEIAVCEENGVRYKREGETIIRIHE